MKIPSIAWLESSVLPIWLYAGLFLSSGVLSSSAQAASPSWNPKAAAAYLDQRASWWIAWPGAARDQGTFCISCHTALPYALSRPALQAVLGDQSANERKVLDSVAKRVHLWQECVPNLGKRDVLGELFPDFTTRPHRAA